MMVNKEIFKKIFMQFHGGALEEKNPICDQCIYNYLQLFDF